MDHKHKTNAAGMHCVPVALLITSGGLRLDRTMEGDKAGRYLLCVYTSGKTWIDTGRLQTSDRRKRRLAEQDFYSFYGSGADYQSQESDDACALCAANDERSPQKIHGAWRSNRKADQRGSNRIQMQRDEGRIQERRSRCQKRNEKEEQAQEPQEQAKS